MGERVYLTVTDDLRRSRLTVLLRLVLALPHLVWFAIWSLAVLLLAVPMWVVTLILGRPQPQLHRFFAVYVRYTIRVFAYLFLVADPWPGFFDDDEYPVDVTIPAPGRQSRWTVALRPILVLPALAFAPFLAGFNTIGVVNVLTLFYVAGLGILIPAFLGWFVCLVHGRMPLGLRNVAAYALGYGAQTSAYLLFLTQRYPSVDPDLVEPLQVVPPHPVRLVPTDDLRRSRLTVFFRLLLALPHLVWLTLWVAVGVPAAFLNWIVTLVRGRPAEPLHRFLSALVRYAFHVLAFVTVVGNPFPGFTGTAGTYPVDLELPLPGRQHRLKTLFRIVLAVPALLIRSIFGNLLWPVAIFGWVVALLTGRMPRGLSHLGASALRYEAQFWSYLLLLTDRYPHATPTVTEPDTEPEPALDGPDLLDEPAEPEPSRRDDAAAEPL
jgi:hypothetical protein